jgi:hypothetical protein
MTNELDLMPALVIQASVIRAFQESFLYQPALGNYRG